VASCRHRGLLACIRTRSALHGRTSYQLVRFDVTLTLPAGIEVSRYCDGGRSLSPLSENTSVPDAAAAMLSFLQERGWSVE
jgi:hypothetical protein